MSGPGVVFVLGCRPNGMARVRLFRGINRRDEHLADTQAKAEESHGKS